MNRSPVLSRSDGKMTCAICGREFEYKPGKLCCSDACRRQKWMQKRRLEIIAYHIKTMNDELRRHGLEKYEPQDLTIQEIIR